MSFTVVANFKSNKTSAEIETWFSQVANKLDQVNLSDLTLVVAPSTLHLPQAASLITKYSLPIKLAAQDVSPFPAGAYTGAVSAKQLEDCQVSYALIGHSERRRYFHESTGDIANKAKELLSCNITPLLCLSQAEITPQFAALDDHLQAKIIYCFEPPADIGGTITAPTEVITSARDMIQAYGDYPVLYGGSVTPDNVRSLTSLTLSGVLVSSASLDPNSYLSILTNLTHVQS